MTVERVVIIHCDYGGCRDWHRFNVDLVSDARRAAKRLGWRAKRLAKSPNTLSDLCPRHATSP